MKKALCLFLVGCLLALSMAGCGNANTAVSSQAAANSASSPTSETQIIRVAVMPQQLSLPLYYISQKGWDVENGFKLELTTFQSGAPMNEALGANLWDVATIGAAGVLSCSVYDAVHIMSHEDSSAGLDFMVRADSKTAKVKGFLPEYPDMYGSPETIKGSTIILPIGSGHQLLLDTYLKAMGLTESDIKMVNMDHPSGYQAFISGQGDFSATAYPTTDDYTKKGYVSAVSMTSAKCPYYDNLVVNRKFYDNPANEKVLVALLTQMLRCADEFKDSDKLLDAMIGWYKTNGQEVTPENVRDQVLKRPFFTVDDFRNSDTTASFKRMAEFFASTKQITQDDLTKVFNNIRPELLQKAIAAYKK